MRLRRLDGATNYYYLWGGHFPELSSRRTSPGGSLSEDHVEIPAIPAILGFFGPLSREFGRIFDPEGLPGRHSWMNFWDTNCFLNFGVISSILFRKNIKTQETEK